MSEFAHEIELSDVNETHKNVLVTNEVNDNLDTFLALEENKDIIF